MLRVGGPELAAEKLIELFAGRRDAYVQWIGQGYVTMHATLTAAAVLSAVRARRPIGAYFLALDNTSHVAALDFDRPDGWNLACRIGAWLRSAGVPTYGERSRDGRAHLWVVAAPDPDSGKRGLPGIVLRYALRAALEANGLDSVPAIELRPGSDRLSRPDGFGHALRLPTMPHKDTGERHPLCDPRTGAPIGRTLTEMLAGIELAPRERLVELAERHRPVEPPAPDRPTRRMDVDLGLIGRFNAHVGVCEVLQREFNVLNAAPGRTVHCPCHDDRRASLSIARDDSRAWCHSPACVLCANGRGEDAYGLWLLAKAQPR